MLEIKNYCKEISKNTVLNNINYTFERGNIYLLEGINGSGKTMILRALAGLIIPNEGYVSLDGEQIKKGSFLPKCGVLIGHTELPHEYTGIKNLELINDIRHKEDIEQLKSYMDLVSLDPDETKLVKGYSMGMRQKLAIAQSFIGNPDVLLLDEPLNSIDKKSCESIVKNLVAMKKDKIIIIAAHNSELVKSIADYVLEIDNGEIYSEN